MKPSGTRWLRFAAMLAAVVALGAIRAADPPARLVLDDGTTHEGKLVALDASQVSLDTGKVQRYPLQRLVRVELLRQPDSHAEPEVRIYLTGGSRFAGRGFRTRDDAAEWTMLDGTTIRTPLKHVAAVRFRAPSDNLDAAWRKNALGDRRKDRVIIRRSGNALDYLDGIIENVSAEVVTFRYGERTLRVPRQKLEGVAFASTGGTDERARAVAYDWHGGLWRLKDIRLVDGAFEATTLCGVTWKTRPSYFRLMSFAGLGRISLVELQPAEVKWQHFFPLPPENGEQGAVPWQEWLKKQYAVRSSTSVGADGPQPSLVLYSGTEIRYRLSEPFERFRARAVVMPSGGGSGHLRLVIEGEGKELLARVLRAGEPPFDIDVPLEGVRRLVIRVEFGRNLHIGDELRLDRPVLVKPSSRPGRTTQGRRPPSSP